MSFEGQESGRAGDLRTLPWAGPSRAHSRSRAGGSQRDAACGSSGSRVRTRLSSCGGGEHTPGAQPCHLGRVSHLPGDEAVLPDQRRACRCQETPGGCAFPSSASGACRLLRESREPRSYVTGAMLRSTRTEPLPTAANWNTGRPGCIWAQRPVEWSVSVPIGGTG